MPTRPNRRTLADTYEAISRRQHCTALPQDHVVTLMQAGLVEITHCRATSMNPSIAFAAFMAERNSVKREG